jgi:4-alpha-glucanotransferase
LSRYIFDGKLERVKKEVTMKFPPIDHKLTGVVVPVFSLRSSFSCGIGEFSDLPLLGQWCKKCNLEIIQILPVNDTGFQESPYSALSAFALHPIFIRLETIKDSELFEKEIKALRKKFEKNKRVLFSPVLKGKLDILQKIYQANSSTIQEDKKIQEWLKENQWARNYAVFSTMRNKNGLASWRNWKEYSNPTSKDLTTLWTEHFEQNYFYIWVQYQLQKQLLSAAQELDNIGVSLKGDIPILMNEDSCDVWSEREYFDLNLSAGAPPDMFSQDGQNWGFPIYNWKNLKNGDYSWWRKRLKEASKFYHAYRIDHVLGFFRIWNIPNNMNTGSMGYFNPSSYIDIQDLYNIGFNDERITWLSKAHIFEEELRDRLGAEADLVINLCLDRINNEKIFLFNSQYESEKEISNSQLSDRAKSVLIEFLKNVTLLKVKENQFSLSWLYKNTRGYESLNDHEKYNLEEISARCGRESEKIWEENALNLLSFMKDTTEMLVCAEDLGAVPDCVPSVLQSLGILGLKVLRWAREWSAEGEPYTPVRNYPLLSVCTPAVHDSTTLRQWWHEEKDKQALAQGLDVSSLNEEPSETAIEFFLQSLLKSSSAICMLQLQDLFALDKTLCDNDMHFERINVPGTVQETNWSYRMNLELEKLLENKNLSGKLQKLISTRKTEKISL